MGKNKKKEKNRYTIGQRIAGIICMVLVFLILSMGVVACFTTHEHEMHIEPWNP